MQSPERISPALGWWVFTVTAGALIALVVPYDTCFHSSNVLRVHAVGIGLILLFGLLGLVLSVRCIRLKHSKWPHYTLMVLTSVLVIGVGFAAAQLTFFVDCPL